MKKRVKLLTTIASLCLAVALMAFGVYAATNPEITVNSTITFTASADLFVDMEVTQTFDGASDKITAKSYTEGSAWATGYTAADPAPSKNAFSPVAFTTAKNSVTYTFKVTNYTKEYGIKATLTLTLNGEVSELAVITADKTELSATGTKATSATGVVVQPAESGVITITLARTDISFAEGLEQTLTLSVEKV